MTNIKNLIERLRESAETFERNATHELPAMQDFIKRHIAEIKEAADALEEFYADIREGRSHGD